MAPRARGTGTIFMPKGSRFFWIAYKSGGKRRYESTKSTRKKDAQELLIERLGAIQKGVVVTPQMGKKTLGDALKAVVDDLTLNGRRSAHDTESRITKHLLAHFVPERRMNTISTSDLTAYVAQRLKEGASPASCNHEMAIVKRAFRLAMRAQELSAMPYIPMLKLNNVRKGFLERDQFTAILAHLPSGLRAPLVFAYGTGWRLRSEVLPLTVDRVDLAAGVVRLDPGTTKNREGRTFYLTTELQAVLQAQLDLIAAFKRQGKIVPYVFHRPDGSPIKNCRGSWRTACERAGLPGKLFHDFRRSAVRNLERAGVPRSTAMAMVGHKTEAIYRRYAIVDEAMHREAAERLNAWAEKQAMGTASDVLRRVANAEG